MLRSVFLKSLRDQRRALLWWGAGLVLLAAVLIAFYPAIRDNPSVQDYMDAMPEALQSLFGSAEFVDITSPAGYLNLEGFGFMLPVLFLIFAIALGTSTIAGEEERGTLELLLSNPISRRRVIIEKFGALVVESFLLGAVVWASLAAGAVIIDMDIGIGRLAEACLGLALLGITFGALAIALGCLRGRRGFGLGVASAVAVAAYFLNALGQLVDILDPYRRLSPLYYYNSANPLADGLNAVHVIVLLAATVVLAGVALIAIERRDLHV